MATLGLWKCGLSVDSCHIGWEWARRKYWKSLQDELEDSGSTIKHFFFLQKFVISSCVFSPEFNEIVFTLLLLSLYVIDVLYMSLI